MSDILRNNWFVILIALIIIGFIGYFIYDTNRDNVSKKTDDGQAVMASIDGSDVTADEFYSEASDYDGSLIYNLYKNEVIDQTIETTDELEEDAKTLQSNIESNASSQDNAEISIASELASYGYSSYDDLYDYCLMTVKEKEMNQKYITKHFDDVKEAWSQKSPRTVSIISMSVADPDNLTEDESGKKTNIETALGKESFADVAEAFSEDTNTASDSGFAGYIDSDSVSSSSSVVPSDVVTAALSLKKGETSDWITVTDSSSGTTSLYKVYVNQTNLNKIFNAKNETVKNQALYAILNSDSTLENTILEKAASKLKIEFNDKETKKKFDNYVESTFGGDE